MGNRDDLLAGAKRCLYEKGYAHTTARDIATASGVSLASIGYHFGSKEALMNEALMRAMEEWGEEVGQALTPQDEPGFAAIWDRVAASVSANPRLWSTQFELIALSEQSPKMRELFTKGNRAARLGLSAIFHGPDPAEDEPAALAAGAFYQAILTGVVAQWLTDPDTAPSGPELATALRTACASLNAEA